MGQELAVRDKFRARETITSSKDDDIQDINKTCFFRIGNIVDHVTEDANGNITTIDNNLIVTGIVKDQSITLSANIDTTTPGTHRLRNQSIQNMQQAMERALCDPSSADIPFNLTEPILDQELNAPAGGQTLYDVGDTAFWRVNDKADIFADSGLLATDVNVDAIDVNADASLNTSTIAIDSLVDISAETNPFLVNKTITNELATKRNQERIDQLDKPIRNERMSVVNGVTEGTLTTFETAKLFVPGTTDFFASGKEILGTVGTLATHTQGTGTSQLDYFANIPGELGNEIEVEVLSGAGLAVTITKSFKLTGANDFSQSQYLISINDNGGFATSKEIADAINADQIASRVVQVLYGGGGKLADGSGVVAAFGAVNLIGGLPDNTEDYSELEIVFENSRVNTGFKFVALHIRPDDRTKWGSPPEQDERIVIGYSQALVNVDR